MDVMDLLLVIGVNCKRNILINIHKIIFVKDFVLIFSLVLKKIFVKQNVLIYSLIRRAFMSNRFNLKIPKHLKKYKRIMNASSVAS